MNLDRLRWMNVLLTCMRDLARRDHLMNRDGWLMIGILIRYMLFGGPFQLALYPLSVHRREDRERRYC